MNGPMDPELEDTLRDPDLLRIAALLGSASTPEPPLDDAFQSSLRRQLMGIAWDAAERRSPWWRRLSSPPAMAWAGAAAVVILVASVVLLNTSPSPSGFTQQVLVQSPQQDAPAVALRQPILVSFNQPMNHATTEAAVHISPATSVTFTWSGDNTLYIQPASGDLAPNTQYQVTIGPGATTQANTPISTPKSFTFVTQPVVTPPPPPTPTPASSSLLTGLVQLAQVPDGTYTPQWSADSTTLYFVGAGGALQAVPAKGGLTRTLVPDGVSLPAISPAGDRIAFARGGKIEILTLADGTTTEVAVTPSVTTLAWVREKLFWGTNDGVYTLADAPALRPALLASIPGPHDATAILSIAPDGAHAVYASAHSLFVLDVKSGSTSPVGLVGAATTFQAWSPDGSRIVYGDVIADLSGKTVSTLPGGDLSWSVTNRILLGADTSLSEVRPDGTGLAKLADGTFHLPVWAPDSSTFAFLRGSGLWAASAPPPPAVPSAIDQASDVVASFMHARLDKNADRASSFLDDAGKAAYSAGHPALLPTGDLTFKRFYVLAAELDPSTPNSVTVVVRLVFASDKLERTAVEETLTLRRTQDTDPFLIDGVSAGAQRDLGGGPQVVAVKITSAQVAVTFNSDLKPETVAGVVVVDSQGNPVPATAKYLDRTVTLSGLQLVAGAHYRLVVTTSVQDVGDHHAASEYDLELIAPAPEATGGGVTPTPAQPSPSPSPTPG
jgi:hypothetical protein